MRKLYIAAMNGDLISIKVLIEKGEDLYSNPVPVDIESESNIQINEKSCSVGDTALDCAIKYGHLEVVSYLHKQGAKGSKNGSLERALQSALDKKYFDTASYVLINFELNEKLSLDTNSILKRLEPKIKIVISPASSGYDGSTQLLNRFVNNSFDLESPRTIGANFSIKNKAINDACLRYLFWDIGGAEKFSSFQPFYSREAVGLVYCIEYDYDLQFSKIDQNIADAKKSSNDLLIFLVITKYDLHGKRNTNWDIATFKEKYPNYPILITSAKTGEGVKEAFDIIMQKTLASYLRNKLDEKVIDAEIEISSDDASNNNIPSHQRKTIMGQLHIAAMKGDLATVISLIESGVPVNEPYQGGLSNSDGFSCEHDDTAIDCAIKNNHIHVMEYLIKNGGISNDESTTKFVETYKEAMAGKSDSQFMIFQNYFTGEFCVEKNEKIALDWLRKAADSGSEDANMVLFYVQNGVGREFFEFMREFEQLIIKNEDKNDAMNWIVKSAEQERPGSKMILALVYFFGFNNIEIDRKKALFLLKSNNLNPPGVYQYIDTKSDLEKAEEGDAQAQYDLASRYLKRTDQYIDIYMRNEESDNVAAFELFHMAAIQDHTESQYMIASMYEEGKGVESSKIKAVEWYAKAAQLGHINSIYKLATICFSYKKEDAEEWLDKSDKQNEQRPLSVLADCYANWGTFTPPSEDYIEHKKFCKKAAEQWHYYALVSLGDMYLTEQNELPINEGKALECYGKAAEIMCAMEYVIDDDEEEMIVWLKKSAEHGNAAAQFSLGKILATTDNVYQNDLGAAKWFKAAAEQGYENAQQYLDQIKIKIQLIEKAKSEDAQAQFELGKMYRYGSSVACQNKEIAFNLFKNSAEKRYIPSQFIIYEMYKKGEGVKEDAQLADDWYNKAISKLVKNANNNHAEACFFLARLYFHGEYVGKDASLSLSYFQKAADLGYQDAANFLQYLKDVKTEQMTSKSRRNSLPRIVQVGAKPEARARSISLPLAIESKDVAQPALIEDINNNQATQDQQSLEQRIKELSSELNQTRDSLHNATELVENLSYRNEELESENDQLKKSLISIVEEQRQNEYEFNQRLAVQQVQVQDLINNTNLALAERESELATLQEVRKQEVEVTQANIQTLEQCLLLSETKINSKTIELSELEHKIDTLQQNSQHTTQQLSELQTEAQRLMAEKLQLEQENQQLSSQCASLKIRLTVLETERTAVMQQQQTGGRDVSQLQKALKKAKEEMSLKENVWLSRIKQANKAGEALRAAKAEVEHQAQLLSIQLNFFKKHGLAPKERAFQDFLADVKRLIGNTQVKPSCYISYAWEDKENDAGKAANVLLHAFLVRLYQDLLTLGLEKVFLDIKHMTGNTTDCMSTNIAKSNCVLLIGTERLQQRAQDNKTNVYKEWVEIEKRMQQDHNFVIPVLYQGDFIHTPPYTNAFPPGIEKNLIRDCRATDKYYDFMAKIMDPMSFIQALFGIHLSGRNEALYDKYLDLWDKLETKLSKIELELANETLRINQSLPHYTMPTVSSANHASSSSTSSPMSAVWKGKAPIKNAISTVTSSSSSSSASPPASNANIAGIKKTN
jgi:TPR repeat protein/GTPase SAR1 family protein